MYMFSRTRTAKPDRIADAIAYAAEVPAQVSTITGLDIHSWQVSFGAPGQFVFTTMVDSQAAMSAAGDALLADPGAAELAARTASIFAGHAEDSIGEVVATSGPGGELGSFATSTIAQCAPGRVADAMAWGVDMTKQVERYADTDQIFARAAYGPFATVAWFSVADSMEEIDKASQARSEDPSYIEALDGAGDLFVQGSARALLSRRIA